MRRPSGLAPAGAGVRLRAALAGSGGLLLVALVAAESAIVWLVTTLALVSPDRADAHLPPFAVFVVLYVAALLPRVLDAFDVWEPGYSLAMTVGLVGSAVFLVKTAALAGHGWLDPAWGREAGDGLILRPSAAELPVWGLLVIVIYAWWRGRRRAEPTLDGAYLQFRIGAPLLLLAVAMHGVATSPVSQRATVGAVLAFFAASLLAISIARLGGLGRASQDQRRAGHEVAVAARGRWLGAVVAPILVVIAVGVVVAGIASRDLLDTVLWALAPLVWGLTVILRVLILVIALVAFILVSPILWLLSGQELEPRRRRPTDSDQPVQDAVQRELDRIAQMPDALRYLLAFLILSAIVSALTRFVLRRRKRTPVAPLEDRESIFSPRDLLDALGARLRALLGIRPRLGSDPLADLRGDRRWRHTITIRELYARLLRQGADLGRPRPRGATANEHGRILEGFPPLRREQGEVRSLTERYNAARYGAEPATREEADAARSAWRRIERALRNE